MQVPSTNFSETSGRLDSATALGDVMTSRLLRGSLESVPPDRARLIPSGQMISMEVWSNPT